MIYNIYDQTLHDSMCSKLETAFGMAAVIHHNQLTKGVSGIGADMELAIHWNSFISEFVVITGLDKHRLNNNLWTWENNVYSENKYAWNCISFFC